MFEFINFISQISIIFGIAMIACAFILPKGPFSPLGILAMGLGVIITIGNFIYMPDGHSYTYHVLYIISN